MSPKAKKAIQAKQAELRSALKQQLNKLDVDHVEIFAGVAVFDDYAQGLMVGGGTPVEMVKLAVHLHELTDQIFQTLAKKLPEPVLQDLVERVTEAVKNSDREIEADERGSINTQTGEVFTNKDFKNEN